MRSIYLVARRDYLGYVQAWGFWLGLLLILLFAVELRLLPASGMFAIYGGGGPIDLLRHLLLPVAAVAAIRIRSPL